MKSHLKYRPQRFPADVHVRLEMPGGMVVARALNGNRLGLGVAAPDGLVVRMPVTVRAPGLEISGRIIWARSGRGGIRFDTPISAQQLSVLRRGVVGSLGKTRATSGRPHLAQVYREL